jgi:hypothetical protein
MARRPNSLSTFPIFRDPFYPTILTVLHHHELYTLQIRLDILAVSETWLNPSISGDLLCIPGFSPMFTLDRKDGRRAGGVALYCTFLLV